MINADVLKPWSADLERVTSGRVDLEFLPKAVGNPAAQFDVGRDGLADFVVVIPSYTSGRFPALDMGEMPLLHSETAILGPAFYPIRPEQAIIMSSATPHAQQGGPPCWDSVSRSS